MKNYVRLLTRLTNAPLFISESKLELISENVLLRIANGLPPNTEWDTSAKIESRAVAKSVAKKSVSANDIAIIDVFDALQAKGAFGGLSGFTTYESLQGSLQSAVASGYTNILLNIDSPGGEVSGLFALTAYIRSLVAQGINITTFVDGMAASAAYAIAAASSARYVTSTSLVGSIGVIMTHMETSIADANAGKTFTILRSKSEKALGDSHTPLSADVKAKFQAILDNMDTLFNNDVTASMPQLSLQSIIDMKGSEFIASDALQLGLIDSIVSGVDSAISMALQRNTKTQASTKLQSNSKGVKMNEDELKAQIVQLQAEVATLKLEAAGIAKVTMEAERARTLSILGATSTLGLEMSTAVKHITRGYDAEASLEMQTDLAESLGKKTAIQGQGNQTVIDPDLDAKLPGSAEASTEDKMASLRAGAKAAGLKLIKGVK